MHIDIPTIIDRLAVIIKAAPTYLTALAVIAGIVLDEIGKVGPVPSWLTVALGAVITVNIVAVAIIRRVTPVIADARGLLPAAGPYTAAENDLLEHLGR